MYGGMGQPGMNPNDPNSLTNSFNQNTQATFQMIESIVGAFGGFAQMLESTYMATHSSFFGMYFAPPYQSGIDFADMFSNSNDLRRRTILQSPHHPRLHPRHLHPSPLGPYSARQNHRPTSTRRCHLSHPLRLRRLSRPLLILPPPQPQPPTNPLQKALSRLPHRRLRPSLPNVQTHPLARIPTIPTTSSPTTKQQTH